MIRSLQLEIRNEISLIRRKNVGLPDDWGRTCSSSTFIWNNFNSWLNVQAFIHAIKMKHFWLKLAPLRWPCAWFNHRRGGADQNKTIVNNNSWFSHCLCYHAGIFPLSVLSCCDDETSWYFSAQLKWLENIFEMRTIKMTGKYFWDENDEELHLSDQTLVATKLNSRRDGMKIESRDRICCLYLFN